MPSVVVFHAAVFTAGAVLGGGLVAVLSSKKESQLQSRPVTSYELSTSTPAIVLDGVGKPQVTSIALPALKYGNPGPITDCLVRQAYVSGYDRKLRHPSWTVEHLTRALFDRSSAISTNTSGDRSKSAFMEDESVPAPFRSKLQDYFRSGYDRGHMVPAADAKISQEAMNETFLLSNIAPQVGDGFNRHYWAYLEEWCRRLTDSFQDVYVFTVPLYLPHKEVDGKWRVTYEVIGNPPNVSVPTHFAKVVLTSKPTSPSTPNILELSSGAFVLPNAIIPDQTPLENFIVPVEAVERAAGLTFFSDSMKAASKHICQSTKCDIVVRRFDDAQKKFNSRKIVAAPK